MLLRLRARRLFSSTRLAERDLAAKRTREDRGQSRLVAGYHRPIGQCHADAGSFDPLCGGST